MKKWISHWILGDGKRISFWHDKWHGPLSLAQIFPGMDFPWSVSVKDFLFDPQRYSSFFILQQAAQFSSSLSASFLLQEEPDALIWTSSNSPSLSFSAAWDSIRLRSFPRAWHKFAWNSLLKPSSACFAWKLFHNKLPTNVWAQSIGVQLASICPLCGSHQDSAPSLFFLCPLASSFWDWLDSKGNLQLASSSSASAKWNAFSANSCPKAKKGLAALFIVALFSIWKERNMALFSNKVPSLQSVINFFLVDASNALRFFSSSFSSSTLDFFILLCNQSSHGMN